MREPPAPTGARSPIAVGHRCSTSRMPQSWPRRRTSRRRRPTRRTGDGEDQAETTCARGARSPGSSPSPTRRAASARRPPPINLGACLAELGQRMLIIDLDPQGNASTGLGIENRGLETSMYHVLMHDVPLENCIEPTDVKGLFVAPASLDLAGAEIELVPAFSRETRLRRAIEAVLDDYDYVLIDCPPSLGLLTVNGLSAAREVLVPIQCEYYALEGLGQLLRNVDLVRRNLNPELEVSTIVCVMYDARTKLADQVVGRGPRALRRQGAADGRAAIGAPVRGAVVRPADHHVRSALAGRDRLPRRRQGGARWLGAAGWVGDSARSSRRPSEAGGRSARRPADLVEIPVESRSRRTPTSPGCTSTRSRWPSWPSRSPRSACCSRCWSAGVERRRYQLIAGERRWRAARRAGLTDRPGDRARRPTTSPPSSRRWSRTSTAQDLTALEEAAAYQQLIEDFELTHDDVATRVGKSRSAVTNTLRLLGLPPAVQHLLADGKLSAGHARALLGTAGPGAPGAARPAGGRRGLVGARRRGGGPQRGCAERPAPRRPTGRAEPRSPSTGPD